jgi:hypothetical protein
MPLCNPPLEHAQTAWARLSHADKLRALGGQDERNFMGYDVIEFDSKSEKRQAKANASAERHFIQQLSEEETMKDFDVMGIPWRR